MNEVEVYTIVTRLRWWEIPIHWWRCKFGKYRKHFFKIEPR